MFPARYDALSPRNMAVFAAGLRGLDADEVRKAKRLHLLDALAGYEALQRSHAAFALVQVLFALIPCFWPILLLQWYLLSTGRAAARQQIANALDVWRDDLGDEADALRDRLETGSAASWLSYAPLAAVGVWVVLGGGFLLLVALAGAGGGND